VCGFVPAMPTRLRTGPVFKNNKNIKFDLSNFEILPSIEKTQQFLRNLQKSV
jgi:hypothetical protein